MPRPGKTDHLEVYREQLTQWTSHEGMSVFLITQRLKEAGCKVSESTVKRFLGKLKKEVYAPIETPPGQQAQVDFGYLGKFQKEGKWVKVWVFCMVLSYSRYAYYSTVTAQSWMQFMGCHRKAFEFFGGVPRSLLIDNLGTAVKEPDIYQPGIRTHYDDFIQHYRTSVLTARPNRGQDKGKVEAGVKYVKNNFGKNCRHRDYTRLEADLKLWNRETCNQRVHGTTRKIPREQFDREEKATLLPLPTHPYVMNERCSRKVDRFGHIFFEYNFYSVPYQYAGEVLIIENDGQRLRICKGLKCIASHALSESKGRYITVETHKPLYKQVKTAQHYQEIVRQIGVHASRLLELMMIEKPYHWKQMIKGIIRLTEAYSNYLVNLACEKALTEDKHSYQGVRGILTAKKYAPPERQPKHPRNVGGFYHALETYDNMAAGFAQTPIKND